MLNLITDEYGTQYWYTNGQRHRVDGPTIIIPDDSQYWYINDQLHRVDGPAVIYADGTQQWYLNGNNIPEDDINKWMTDLDISYPFDEE